MEAMFKARFPGYTLIQTPDKRLMAESKDGTQYWLHHGTLRRVTPKKGKR